MYASEDMSPNKCLAWKALYYIVLFPDPLGGGSGNKTMYYTAQDMATDLLYSRRENGNFHLSYHAWQLLDIELWLEL